jgi:hypothetical protein
MVCGRKFDAVRSTAKTCSEACRQVLSRARRTATPSLPSAPFDLIVADPPLDFETSSGKGQGRSPSKYYPTMSLDWLLRLPIADIAAADAGLALWVYGPRLPDALKLIDRWGFKYKSDLVTWVKTTASGALAFGTGYYTRKCTEQMLYATRGRGLKRIDAVFPNALWHADGSTVASRMRHSKPSNGCSARFAGSRCSHVNPGQVGRCGATRSAQPTIKPKCVPLPVQANWSPARTMAARKGSPMAMQKRRTRSGLGFIQQARRRRALANAPAAGVSTQSRGVRLSRDGRRSIMNRSECRWTAYHEAGHAVANALFGLCFRFVTIVPSGHLLGRIEREQQPIWRRQPRRITHAYVRRPTCKRPGAGP